MRAERPVTTINLELATRTRPIPLPRAPPRVHQPHRAVDHRPLTRNSTRCPRILCASARAKVDGPTRNYRVARCRVT
eukprot:6241101-Pyramimonas_sp.AAC.2